MNTMRHGDDVYKRVAGCASGQAGTKLMRKRRCLLFGLVYNVADSRSRL